VAVVYPGTALGALFGDAEDLIFGIPEEAWALSRAPISTVELVFFLGSFISPLHTGTSSRSISSTIPRSLVSSRVAVSFEGSATRSESSTFVKRAFISRL